jgi:hypothetical protein
VEARTKSRRGLWRNDYPCNVCSVSAVVVGNVVRVGSEIKVKCMTGIIGGFFPATPSFIPRRAFLIVKSVLNGEGVALIVIPSLLVPVVDVNPFPTTP